MKSESYSVDGHVDMGKFVETMPAICFECEIYSVLLIPLCRPFNGRTLTPMQILELEVLLDFFPMMHLNLQGDAGGRVCRQVYASDASLTGGSVTYCDLTCNGKA